MASLQEVEIIATPNYVSNSMQNCSTWICVLLTQNMRKHDCKKLRPFWNCLLANKSKRFYAIVFREYLLIDVELKRITDVAKLQAKFEKYRLIKKSINQMVLHYQSI